MGALGWIRSRLGLARSRAAGSLGARGESEAAAYLKRNKFRVIARNVRLPIGEIDLLAETPDRRTVVVVEVKSRTVGDGDAGRLPERAITRAKGRKLASLAASVSRRKGIEGRPIRIDVVAVEFAHGSEEPLAVRHYPGAINAHGKRV